MWCQELLKGITCSSHVGYQPLPCSILKWLKHSSIIFSHQCDYPNKYIVKVINSKLRNSKVLCRTRINNGATQLVENKLKHPPCPLEWTNSSETLHCPSSSTRTSGKILEMKDKSCIKICLCNTISHKREHKAKKIYTVFTFYKIQ
jgi:hypothetical protein